MVCSMYCDYFILCFFLKIKCPGKIPNIQGIWDICPGNQWFQVGNSGFTVSQVTDGGSLIPPLPCRGQASSSNRALK